MTDQKTYSIDWIDYGRKATVPPNPGFPKGRDVDLSRGAPASCYFELPMVDGCGCMVVQCMECGYRIGLTMAGRADDPRSVKVPCMKPEDGSKVN
jgi:hypothetical protein